MMASMKVESLRWVLLPVAVLALLALILRGLEPRSAAVFAVCGLAWFALSRRKMHSLDRDPAKKPGRA